MAKPTLVITGTDDNAYMPHADSLIIAEKIPGAWLVQIKDAGHAVMSHQLNIINKMLQTLLSTTTINLTAHSLTEYADSTDYIVFYRSIKHG
jgi:hypothetical protein